MDVYFECNANEWYRECDRTFCKNHNNNNQNERAFGAHLHSERTRGRCDTFMFFHAHNSVGIWCICSPCLPYIYTCWPQCALCVWTFRKQQRHHHHYRRSEQMVLVRFSLSSATTYITPVHSCGRPSDVSLTRSFSIFPFHIHCEWTAQHIRTLYARDISTTAHVYNDTKRKRRRILSKKEEEKKKSVRCESWKNMADWSTISLL